MRRPNRTIDNSPNSLGLIPHLLKVPGATFDSSTVAYTDSWLPGLLWELFDTGISDENLSVTGETLLHILHVQHEDGSFVDVDGQALPFHPGDTISITGTAHASISAGVLMLIVRSQDFTGARIIPPSHGVESFDGFNRRTTYDSGQHMTFERWKLTTPQTIGIEPGRAMAMVGLFGSISCIQEGTIETLRAGESLVTNGGRVRLIPDGLAYIALMWADQR